MSESRDTLIFLDVDGVINYTGWQKDAYGFDWRSAYSSPILPLAPEGYNIRFPSYMPRLVQHLMDNYEVRWLTTWRGLANTEILPILGLTGELAVVDDGSDDHYVEWKLKAVRPQAKEAVEAGRRVLWIEDFFKTPFLHGVEMIRTLPEEVLCPWHINDLLPEDMRMERPKKLGLRFS